MRDRTPQSQGNGEKAYIPGRVIVFGVFMLSVACLVNTPCACWAQQPADNAEIHKRLLSQNELSMEQQSEAKRNRKPAQKIHRAIATNKSLTTGTQNVKIVRSDADLALKFIVVGYLGRRFLFDSRFLFLGSDRTSQRQYAVYSESDRPSPKGTTRPGVSDRLNSH
jgi:hypothetical protein